MLDAPTIIRLGPDPGADDLVRVADRVAAELSDGGIVVVPTDTVYGVAAHPAHSEAVERLFAVKDRDRTKALAVLAADAAQAEALLDLSTADADVRGAVAAMTAAGWPGALTVVGPRSVAWRPVDLGGDPSTIGVRVPASPVVRAVARRIGPIVTTSANRTGQPTPTDASTAAASLGGPVAVVVDAGSCGGRASTVVDVGRIPFRVLRAGPFDSGPYEAGAYEAGPTASKVTDESTAAGSSDE